MPGVYIHVPFCKSRCIYCDFFSTTRSEEWKRSYVDALLREMHLRRQELPVGQINSLYLGGGTPSQLSIQDLTRIFDGVSACFSLADDAEVTLEANPDDVSKDWLEGLRGTPVNRISMGVQTFHDELLRRLRRRHTSRQALQAVELCRAAGYENLSLDLIYGLPGQTLEMWRQDVAQLLSLRVPHLSAYALSYEEGTELSRMLERGEVAEVEDEVSWQMYLHLMDEARVAGYDHYEISNFSLPGKHSRHNSSYWDGTAYLGLGPGAHSYDGKSTRRSNNADLRAYVAAEGDAPHRLEKLSAAERYDELVMTRLRTAAGLPLSLLSQEQRDYCLRMARPHIQTGRLLLQDDTLRLSRPGIFVSNDVISELFYVV